MVTAKSALSYEVPLEKLRWRCDPSQFCFECTEEIEPLAQFVGQDRALHAVEFGLAMDRPGYNIFVTGLAGTGKSSVIKTYLQNMIAEKGVDGTGYRPADWCYVFGFGDPDRPRSLRLPRGKGRVLRAGMSELIAALRRGLAKAFSGEEYQNQHQQIVEDGQARGQALFGQMERQAQAAGFLLQMSAQGVALIPLAKGRPMDQETFMALPEEQREAISAQQREFLEKVEEAMEQAKSMEKEVAEQVRDLDRRVASLAVADPFKRLQAQFPDLQEVQAYLDAVRSHALANLDSFREGEARSETSPVPALAAPGSLPLRDPFLPYRVNLLVDNAESKTAPVVIETNPTWINLFGQIERRAMMGTYVSDHMMLKPGALSQANGGYLVVSARDLLTNPGVWEGLKRSLRIKELRLEDPAEQFGLLAPQGLRPQPIPLEVKVIVTGDTMTYQTLAQYDEDFWEIFKVRADFDYQIERTPDHSEAYAGFVSATCQSDGLRHFDRSAVAWVMEQGARAVADQTKLSARFGALRDVLVEADYWAGKAGSSVVAAEHVRRAVEERVYRSSLMADRIRDLIADGTLMVDLESAVVGQVNGLAVYELGDLSFGRPSRITARTFMGRAGVINVEREAQLSGRTHDKGVLILSGFLGSRFAQDVPLSLTASVCFEQSYDGIDGDSASSTELYAILSSLADVPLRQGIAVTGSVNQQGQIQAIGGVNEKVEGFFEVCQAIGLTGEQGVIIPQANVKNLMLRESVLDAVKQGKFRVYAVRTVDEGIAILTGLEAGERGSDGSYPEGTVNWLVSRRLHELAEGMKNFSAASVGR